MCGLNLNAVNTELVMFTRKRRTPEVLLTLINGTRLTIGDNARYLGLMGKKYEVRRIESVSGTLTITLNQALNVILYLLSTELFREQLVTKSAFRILPISRL